MGICKSNPEKKVEDPVDPLQPQKPAKEDACPTTKPPQHLSKNINKINPIISDETPAPNQNNNFNNAHINRSAIPHAEDVNKHSKENPEPNPFEKKLDKGPPEPLKTFDEEKLFSNDIRLDDNLEESQVISKDQKKPYEDDDLRKQIKAKALEEEKQRAEERKKLDEMYAQEKERIKKLEKEEQVLQKNESIRMSQERKELEKTAPQDETAINHKHDKTEENLDKPFSLKESLDKVKFKENNMFIDIENQKPQPFIQNDETQQPEENDQMNKEDSLAEKELNNPGRVSGLQGTGNHTNSEEVSNQLGQMMDNGSKLVKENECQNVMDALAPQVEKDNGGNFVSEERLLPELMVHCKENKIPKIEVNDKGQMEPVEEDSPLIVQKKMLEDQYTVIEPMVIKPMETETDNQKVIGDGDENTEKNIEKKVDSVAFDDGNIGDYLKSHYDNIKEDSKLSINKSNVKSAKSFEQISLDEEVTDVKEIVNENKIPEKMDEPVQNQNGIFPILKIKIGETQNSNDMSEQSFEHIESPDRIVQTNSQQNDIQDSNLRQSTCNTMNDQGRPENDNSAEIEKVNDKVNDKDELFTDKAERKSTDMLEMTNSIVNKNDRGITKVESQGKLENLAIEEVSAKEEVKEEVKDEVKDEVKEEVKDEVKEEVKDEVKEEMKEDAHCSFDEC